MHSANAAGVDLSQLLRLGAVPAAAMGCNTGVWSVALFVTMVEQSWVELGWG